MHRRKKLLITIFTALLFIASGTAITVSAATFTVTNANDSGAGSLRQAIIDANAAAGADTIDFDSSFSSPQTITLASTLLIDSVDNTALTITGPGANLLTVSGNNTVRVLEVRNLETVTITGMTMTQGNSLTGTSPGFGGAIYIGNATATLNGVVVSGNSATGGGGGIRIVSNFSITITNSTITNNTTFNFGGGIYVSSPNSNPVGLTITNTTISNNSIPIGGSSYGGGIHNVVPMNMDNCLVTGNTVELDGGGIYISTSSPQTITNSVISNNSADRVIGSTNNRGGGIYRQLSFNNGMMTISNTLVTGNSAEGDGGGIYDAEGMGLNIIGSTITNNTANSDNGGNFSLGGGNGGGIFLLRESVGGSVATITNSTISGNNVLGPGGSGTFVGNGGGIFTSSPLNMTNSTVSGNTVTNSGGGIVFAAVTAINRVHNITSSTIANNTVPTGQGGGVRRFDNDALTTVNLRNSIFANNTDIGTAPDIDGIFNSDGFNLIENTTGATIGGTTASNITGQDPNLGVLQNNGGTTFTHLLLTNSPAIDQGESSGSTDDQRSQSRPFDDPAITNAPGGDGADIGAVEVQPVAVSGTITYGNAIGSPVPPRFVKNVSLSSTVGSPSVGPVITGTPGTYTLTGFGSGSYTIKPTKPGGANGAITSNDAARVAQGVSASVPFVSQNQRFVADASGNGTVSSNDAALIARFAAGLTGTGNVGQWKFFVTGAPSPLPTAPQTYDDSRTYASVTGNLTGEDYVALLVGEASGNWNPATHPRPAGGSAKRLAVGGGPERNIAVELPQMTAWTDKPIIIPVSVQGAADKGIISYEFDLRYDPAVIQPLENPVDVAGTISRGLFVVANPHEPGLLRVIVYGPMPIDENGILLNLRFTQVGVVGSISPLTFERIMFNEGEPSVIVTGGLVEISMG